MTFFKLPVGSCGSGADPDCDNRDSGDDEYDMILCCPITGEEVITKKIVKVSFSLINNK